MAGVEKLDGTPEQWDELYEWLVVENYDLIKCMRRDRPNQISVIAHFSREDDVWLWNNSPFKWLIDALWEQYDGPPSTD